MGRAQSPPSDANFNPSLKAKMFAQTITGKRIKRPVIEPSTTTMQLIAQVVAISGDDTVVELGNQAAVGGSTLHALEKYTSWVVFHPDGSTRPFESVHAAAKYFVKSWLI